MCNPIPFVCVFTIVGGAAPGNLGNLGNPGNPSSPA